MADYPRKGNRDRTVRSHSEQIRRIRTRIPISGLASTWQITSDDLNNDTGAGNGWFVEGLPYPAFVRQGDIVYLNGAFMFAASFTGDSGTIIPIGGIPAEFRPAQFARTDSNGFGFTDDRLWKVYIWSDGRMTLASMHSGGYHPNLAWGRIDDGSNHTLNIEACYPAASLGLGAIPP